VAVDNVAKILLVEDDEDLAVLVEERLTSERHTVETVANGNDAMAQLQSVVFDLIVLDWELPGLDGIEILHRFRAQGGKTPVIMLTGRAALLDKERGFDHGTDDYLAKPFDLRELIMRVRALLRRPPVVVENVLNANGIVLDPIKYRVTKAGVEIHLLPRDFALLEFFMRHPDEVFSADALLQRVWKNDSEATNQSLRVAISRIRKAIDEGSVQSSMIENIARVGYRFRNH
jgi:OmpR-family two-component system manganese-sensing response regulator